MKRKILIVIIILIILLTFLLIRYFKLPKREKPAYLATDGSAYLNWDSVCTDLWDELAINQMETVNADQPPHSVCFYKDGQLVKTVKIPETIVFWMDEDQPVTVFRASKDRTSFVFQGMRHLSSVYTYGLYQIMTIGDGFFAKCYLYQNEGND